MLEPASCRIGTSPAGGRRLAIRFFEPAADLRDVVARIYVHDTRDSAITGGPWLIVPDGEMKVIFPFRGAITCTIADAVRRHAPSRLIVSAMRTAPGHLAFPDGVAAVGVVLRTEAAYRLLGVPMHEIRNRTVDGGELFGSGCREWEARIMDAPSAERRVAAMESGLRGLFRRSRRCDPILEHAVRRLRQRGGRVRIEDLARETGWSRRHLDRVFLERVGTGPKSLADVFRFHAVYKALRSLPPADHARVVYDHYYDQPHFLKSFKRYAGSAPRAYRQANDYGRFYIPA